MNWRLRPAAFLRRLPILALLAILAVILASQPLTAAGETQSRGTRIVPEQQQACEMDKSVQVKLKYLLYLPKAYEDKEAWPLTLFLHGAGERGEDLQLVKKHGPPKLIDQGKQFPFIVASPQCPQGRWWQPMELAALLDELVARYKVEQSRVYVTGLSMGGYGTWALAAYQPERFAALAPICGGSDPVRAKYLAGIPTWIFHGRKDSVVPVERSEAMFKALEKLDSPVRLTVYDDANHDSWTETYANPALYDWLLQQKRTPAD